MGERRHADSVCEVWEGDAREVAAGVAPGSCSLAILDGPYAMGKAAWDRQGLDGLPDWYRPHLEDAGRVCAASASLYVWNTAAGWARLDPLIRSMGWTFRALIVWNKGGSPATISAKWWPEVFEVSGMYSRGAVSHICNSGLTAVWRMAPTSFAHEKMRSEKTLSSVKDGYSWFAPLHPCQKPVLFARRMIEASTRPGERVWVPFGGTLRECIAARDIARENPDDARYVITAELNQDGPDYIGAALRQYHGHGTKPVDPSQTSLFGGA